MVNAKPNTYPIAAYLQEFGIRPLSTILLERAALLYGLNTVRVGPVDFVAADGQGRQMAFSRTASVLGKSPCGTITRNKHSTRLLLERAGVPVPRGRRFQPSDVEPAGDYAESIGYPLVVKPLTGSEGRGVVTDITSRAEVSRAFENLMSTEYASDDVIVEEQIKGEGYRFLVLGDEVVSVLVKRRGRVLGDGVKDVRTLIAERQRFRQHNPHLLSRPIKISESLVNVLERQGVTLNSVPGPGEQVLISHGSNTHQGGEHEQVMASVHHSYIEASVRAVKAIPGLNFAGVDFLIEDASIPLSKQRAAICEVNSVPGADTHEYPLHGEPRPVAESLVLHAANDAQLAFRREPLTELNLRLEMVGRMPLGSYEEWIAERASRMGIVGWVRRTGERSAQAVLQGSPSTVSIMIVLAHLGPSGTAMRNVCADHVDPEEFGAFRIHQAVQEVDE